MPEHCFKPSILFGTLAACLLLAPISAQARKEIVLYSFCQTGGCPDGQYPYSSLVEDAQGNLYGTTLAGGNSADAGTIYELQKVQKNWVFHSLYSFCSQTNCADGNLPQGSLIVDASGNLYGTTYLGGSADKGVVYELQKNGGLRALYNFCSSAQCSDGANPEAGLAYQGQQSGQLYNGTSTLYGTTENGGGMNWGVVYTIAPDAAELVLYSFGANNNTNDGQAPQAPLILDGAGNLYGTTAGGGATGDGTIFSVSSSGSESLLFAFCSQESQDCGTQPIGGLLMNADGSFVGTTLTGGDSAAGGVIYRFTTGAYSTIANFCSRPTCKTGLGPEGLVQSPSGSLYGVAVGGGKNVGTNGGTVFELTGTTLTAPYSFCTQQNCTDGAHPTGTLFLNRRGALFGTTSDGGAYNGGTIFELP